MPCARRTVTHIILLFQLLVVLVKLIICTSFNPSITGSNLNSPGRLYSSNTALFVLPKEQKFLPNQIEILRALGRIDVQVDKTYLEELKRDSKADSKIDFDGMKKSGKSTFVRIFEAKTTTGVKCFLKEYLPVGTYSALIYPR